MPKTQVGTRPEAGRRRRAGVPVILAAVLGLAACGGGSPTIQPQRISGALESPAPATPTPTQTFPAPIASPSPSPTPIKAAGTPTQTGTRPSPSPIPATATTQAPSTVSYKNCDAVRAAGAAPIHRGDPGYKSALDRDGDGIGCE
jgi:excalibur calcium-binding domain-containing protein